jgi:hypothetical protein
MSKAKLAVLGLFIGLAMSCTTVGPAQSLLKVAQSQAQANDLLNRSLTAQLIQIKSIEKWDGVLPQVSGAATPFISMAAPTAK